MPALAALRGAGQPQLARIDVAVSERPGADMLRRLDRRDEARGAFERALTFADNDQVRRFIELRLGSRKCARGALP